MNQGKLYCSMVKGIELNVTNYLYHYKYTVYNSYMDITLKLNNNSCR